MNRKVQSHCFARMYGYSSGYQFLICDLMLQQRFVFQDIASIRCHQDFAREDALYGFQALRKLYAQAQRLAFHDNSIPKAVAIHRLNHARCQRLERALRGGRLP
ncbi:hypothetical protein ABC502_14405 [Alkalimonas sp. NCh-2]|uniref:hypothetical protein n=1 Tax=Alkalimonas sp. NCh-2 TaxID=3144846 RepID=UPI0031F646B7